MKQGKIVKGIAGFYYVHVVESGIYECKAKGAFRKDKIKPLVGDNVLLEVIDEQEKTGNVVEILPRHNALIRPAVANVDQALVVFAAAAPDPNLNLLDRFLIMMEQQYVPSVICFNKSDLVDAALLDVLRKVYEKTGYPVYFFSARTGEGVDAIRTQLEGKTSTVAGPSGVGKSSLINLLSPEEQMETGAISEKIQRGKHTTRHSQFITLNDNTFILDTPGFSSLSVDFNNPGLKKTVGGDRMIPVETATLYRFFPEMEDKEQECRFAGCSHISEPDCGIKNALATGGISQSRYDNYVQIYQELKEKEKRKYC